MRAIVVGLGVQGNKRRRVAGLDFVTAVDPFNAEAECRSVEDVALDRYDAAIVCVPDDAKAEVLRYLLKHGKHVLVEKPLWASSENELVALEDIARARGALCYTAYNHRFEPHYARMRDLIQSKELGKIYSCRMFYGNGTARLVRASWRDQGAGVLQDLGSHLLDVCFYWFGVFREDLRIVTSNRFENQAPDHVIVSSEASMPRLELEMTLLMWRNHFTCDILAENGTAHIESLCKWGPATFTKRKRILPSGRPPEESVTLVQDDPTWALEYSYFRELCASGAATDLSNDRWIYRELQRMSAELLP